MSEARAGPSGDRHVVSVHRCLQDESSHGQDWQLLPDEVHGDGSSTGKSVDSVALDRASVNGLSALGSQQDMVYD